MAKTLKKIKYDGKDVQVESAIRDGDGNTITSTYALASSIPTDIVSSVNGATPDDNGNVLLVLPVNTNQTIKTNSVTFGTNAAVEIAAGSNITVTGNSSNNTITIAATDTNTDTTYTFAEGSTDLAFSVTPSGGSAQSVAIHGLGNAAKKGVATFISSSSTNNDLATAKAVYDLVDALPTPMVFKGTLGTGGTITTLPAAASSNNGHTYKVITAGTYQSIVCKIGDVLTSNGSAWILIPAGDVDTDTDTWRNIKVDDTELLGAGISSGAVNFKSGSNVTITGSGNDITIAATDTNTKVTQVPSSDNSQFPLLCSYTTTNSAKTDFVNLANKAKLNPSTGTITSDGYANFAGGVKYLTSNPSTNNTSGGLGFVVLSAANEPTDANKRTGYIYFIVED